MNYIIKENECGLVTRNGKFIKVIKTGKYNLSRALGYKVKIVEMEGELIVDDIPIDVLLAHMDMANILTRVQNEDGEMTLVYVNNSIRYWTCKKDAVYFKVFHQVETKRISMMEPYMPDNITKYLINILPAKYYTKIVVSQGEIGILYFNNRMQKTLDSGIYYFWNYAYNISCKIVNLKSKELNITGQEILTVDKVGIRININCTYKIVNPIEVINNIGNLDNELYACVQLIVRELVGKYKLDEILDQKAKISVEIEKAIREKQGKYFVEFCTIGIKDIILPGEIKDIMNTVLIAEKTAQANVITRREEVASTRSLLNTAKLMDENKTLYKLKELETIERICKQVGNISLSGGNDLLEQLNKILVSRQ